MRDGLTLQGGFNTGQDGQRQLRDSRADSRADRGRHRVGCGPRRRTRRTRGATIDIGLASLAAPALASYLIPKVDVLFGTTFRSDQGGPLAANYTIPLAVAQAGGLNRAAFANGISPIVNLVQPGTLCGDRVNELDFKIAKVLRFGSTRTNVGLEVFNALNSAAVLTYNQAFNPLVQSGPGAMAAADAGHDPTVLQDHRAVRSEIPRFGLTWGPLPLGMGPYLSKPIHIAILVVLIVVGERGEHMAGATGPACPDPPPISEVSSTRGRVCEDRERFDRRQRRFPPRRPTHLECVKRPGRAGLRNPRETS